MDTQLSQTAALINARSAPSEQAAALALVEAGLVTALIQHGDELCATIATGAESVERVIVTLESEFVPMTCTCGARGLCVHGAAGVLAALAQPELIVHRQALDATLAEITADQWQALWHAVGTDAAAGLPSAAAGVRSSTQVLHRTVAALQQGQPLQPHLNSTIEALRGLIIGDAGAQALHWLRAITSLSIDAWIERSATNITLHDLGVLGAHWAEALAAVALGPNEHSVLQQQLRTWSDLLQLYATPNVFQLAEQLLSAENSVGLEDSHWL